MKKLTYKDTEFEKFDAVCIYEDLVAIGKLKDRKPIFLLKMDNLLEEFEQSKLSNYITLEELQNILISSDFGRIEEEFLENAKKRLEGLPDMLIEDLLQKVNISQTDFYKKAIETQKTLNEWDYYLLRTCLTIKDNKAYIQTEDFINALNARNTYLTDQQELRARAKFVKVAEALTEALNGYEIMGLELAQMFRYDKEKKVAIVERNSWKKFFDK